MQWLSNSLLKDVQINNTQETVSIETILPVIPATVPELKSEQLPEVKEEKIDIEQIRAMEEKAARAREAVRIAEELEKIERLKEEVLTKAQEEADLLVATAQGESDQIKEKAYQEAFEDGEKAGQESGYQAGMEQSVIMARDILQTAQENAYNYLHESQKYVQEKKSEWTDAIVEMAEALIKKEFELDEETILSVLEPLWMEIEQPDQLLTVRTNPQHAKVIQEKLEEKKSEILNFRYVVLKELDYSPYQVEVESDEKLLIFNLKKELEQFLNQIKEDEQDEL